jgi:hypothetical protein
LDEYDRSYFKSVEVAESRHPAVAAVGAFAGGYDRGSLLRHRQAEPSMAPPR